MATPLGNAKDFKTLCVDFALRVGLISYTDGALELPDDISDLETIRRMVNDGYRLFMRSDPDWSFLVQTVSLTFAPAGDGPDNVDGDAAVYRLPSWVSSRGLNDYVFAPATGLHASIVSRSASEVDRLRQTQSTAGYPRYFAERFVPSKDAAPSAPVVPVVVFYPTPSAVYTVTNQYRVAKFTMDIDEELPVCGPEHDSAVLAAAVWCWERHDKPGTPEEASARSAWADELVLSRQIDHKRRGTRLGPMVKTRTTGGYRETEDHGVPLYIEGLRQV